MKKKQIQYLIDLNKDNFTKVAKTKANLTEDDIDLGWNTRNELPDEIVDAFLI